MARRSPRTLESIKRVAVIDNVGNDMFLLRKNQGQIQFIVMQNLLGSDIDVSAEKLLEDKLAARHTIVPVSIDYSAMAAAENRLVQEAAASGQSADDPADNIDVLKTGLRSEATNNVDAYIYVYRSNAGKCEMYGLNSSGALVIGPIVSVSGDRRWTGQGLTLYGFHDWLAGEKYFLAANVGILILDSNFHPIAPQLGNCAWSDVDKSSWIGPTIDKELDGFDRRNIDAEALTRLKQQFPAVIQKATLQILSDMGFAF